jgi:hypothetical protein
MDVLVLTFLVACLRLLAAAAVPLTIASAVILPVIVVSEYREPLGRIFRTLRALVARWSHESTRRISLGPVWPEGAEGAVELVLCVESEHRQVEDRDSMVDGPAALAIGLDPRVKSAVWWLLYDVRAMACCQSRSLAVRLTRGIRVTAAASRAANATVAMNT